VAKYEALIEAGVVPAKHWGEPVAAPASGDPALRPAGGGRRRGLAVNRL
jgi:hypothetical protein